MMKLFLAVASAGAAMACAPKEYRSNQFEQVIDPFEQAVLNLGERCYPGNPFRPSGTQNNSGRDLAPEIAYRLPGLLSALVMGTKQRPFLAPQRLLSTSKGGFLPLPQAAPALDLTGISDLKELSTLGDIERALYRKAQSELVLIGPPADDGGGLRYDDWITAFRSVTQFGSPGVSIDPGDNPSLMKVRYLGGIEHTHMGHTFFEADRALKLLSTGFDNLDCSRWPFKPEDMLTQLDLMDAEMRTDDGRDRGWHRYWFEPSEETVKEEALAALFPTRRLVVLDESIPPGRTSWSAQQFASDVSARFLALTSTIPAFAALQRQAVLVAVAKWMLDKGIPAEKSWVEREPQQWATQATTPSITVLRATLLDQAYLQYGIHGGVDFQKGNKYVGQIGVLRPLTAALRARPSKSIAWNFVAEGKRYRAIAFKYRSPVRMTQLQERWQRITVSLPQPGVERLIFPQYYIRGIARLVIRNDDAGAVVTVRVVGPTRGIFIVPARTQTSIGVQPGSYQLVATASCGTRQDASDVREGAIATHMYSCQTVIR